MSESIRKAAIHLPDPLANLCSDYSTEQQAGSIMGNLRPAESKKAKSSQKKLRCGVADTVKTVYNTI
jgi:hypothetical protein